MPSIASIKNKVSKVFGNGKLEKAYFVRYKKSGDSYKFAGKVQVQFNPAEYSVQRGAKQSDKKALGRDISSSDIQTVNSDWSTLSLSLYFDSYTELKSEEGIVDYTASIIMRSHGKPDSKASLPSTDMNEESSPPLHHAVNKRFVEFLELIKYNHEEHEPPHVGFVWGNSVFFVGKISSQSTQYTVFDRDGTPVRAKLTMTIVGEDTAFDNEEYPLESPDRTKQRTLRYGDQLWMMAQDEYGDVAHWKTIAQANGILNPRAIDSVVRLKVPSIR